MPPYTLCRKWTVYLVSRKSVILLHRICWWSLVQIVTCNCLSLEQMTCLFNFAVFSCGWCRWGTRDGNSPSHNAHQPILGEEVEWVVLSVYIEKWMYGFLALDESFFSAAKRALCISSSLAFVSTLNFLWINPRVMNQKVLRLLCFCYEFLFLGVCNAGAKSCADLNWLENWVRRFKLQGKYFLRMRLLGE